MTIRRSASSAASRPMNPRVPTEDDRLTAFTTRFEDERPSSARRTSSTARRVVAIQVKDFVVWSFESAGRWTGKFCLVELTRRSMAWYILVRILAAGCLRSGNNIVKLITSKLACYKPCPGSIKILAVPTPLYYF